MESNTNNLPDSMDIVVIIDKEKLPEDVLKMIDANRYKNFTKWNIHSMCKRKM